MSEAPSQSSVTPAEGASVAAPAPVQQAAESAAPATPAIPAATSAETLSEAPKAPEAAAPAETPALEKSLLSDAPKPEEVKPAPVKPEQSAEPQPVAYEPFRLPDGVTVDADRLKIFTEALGAQRAPQDFGQKLVDMHMEELARVRDAWTAHQVEAWNTTQNAWKDQVRNDPEIGGSRFETTLQAARGLIGAHGGSPAEQQALLEALDITGAGNNPAVIRFLSRLGAAMKEGAPAPMTSVTPKQDPITRRYGSSLNVSKQS